MSADEPKTEQQAPSRMPVTLPRSRATSRWISQGTSLLRTYERAEATARADYDRVLKQAQTRVDAARVRVEQAVRQRKAVQVALGAVQVEGQPAASEGNGTAPDDKRWSRQHDACIGCGTTTIKHAAHGLCRSCEGRRRHAQKRELEAVPPEGGEGEP